MARPPGSVGRPLLPELSTSVRADSIRRPAPWVAVWAATLALTALTSTQSLGRYREFRSGWPWDLAYNNQWFWALRDGNQTLTVRPVQPLGRRGPVDLVEDPPRPDPAGRGPVLRDLAGPETLIVAQNAILWWVLPAAFGLVLAESRSVRLALAGAALVPMTPLLWPMLWNDFREMELALPFVLWAIWGYRTRRRGLAALGVVGMLASREEFGIMLATFALLPAKEPEEIGITYAWARWSAYLGSAWIVLVFLGYEHLTVGRAAPEQYLAHLALPKPGPWLTLRAAAELLTFGVASWTVLAVLAPRIAILAFPWVWGLAAGRWILPELGSFRWGSVRYSAPMVAVLMAAGLVGFARLGAWAQGHRRGRWVLAGTWLAAAVGFGLANVDLSARMDRIEWSISIEEAREIWRWIDQVGPEDGVVSAYEVSAPLSSRRTLRTNRLEPSIPQGYPALGPGYRWAFLRAADPEGSDLLKQGFERVHLARSSRSIVGASPGHELQLG